MTVTPEPTDIVVREAASAVVTTIAEKVEDRAFKAKTFEPSSTEPEQYLQEQRDQLQAALDYATSALRGVATALNLGQGGYVGWDDETSLYFHGFLEGAVIDRDNSFSVHT